MRNQVIVVGMCAVLGFIGGCKKDAVDETKKAAAEKPVQVAPAANPVDILSALSASLPANVDALVTADLGAGLDALFGSAMGMKLKHDAQFRRELSELLVKHVGLDLTAVKQVAAFVTIESKSAGLIATGDWSKATFRGEAEDIDGVKVYTVEDARLAIVGGKLAVGTEPAIRTLIAVHAKKSPALAGTDAIKKHSAARARIAGGEVAMVVSFEIPRVLAKAPPLPAPFTDLNLDMGVISLGLKGSVAVAVSGEETSRTRLKTVIDGALTQANAELVKFHKAAKTSADPAEAFAGLFAYHGGVTYLDLLKVADADGWLSASAKIELNGGIAMIGVLAAVAVPAFVKYMRRAKTTEAIAHLDKMTKGAVVHFGTPRVNDEGELLPCSFPATVKDTPSTSACDSPGETYEPDTELWLHPTWTALSFDVQDNHRYRYSFESSGTGDSAIFTARAHADLDCDGVFSTFAWVGTGSKDGSSCTATRGAIFKDKETE